MKAQGTLALIATTLVTLAAGAGVAHAQPLPPMYGPPAYQAQGAYPPVPPRYVRGAPVALYDDALLPQEVVGILRSTGYAPLGAPARHGRFYVIAAMHPNGTNGRVTMGAFSGRLVRFVPANQVQPIDPGVASAPPASSTIASNGLPPPPRGLRPPASVPKSGLTPVPAPKPAELAAQSPTTGSAAPATTGSIATTTAANTAAATPPPAPRPVDTKPAVQLQPTQPLPPVQALE